MGLESDHSLWRVITPFKCECLPAVGQWKESMKNTMYLICKLFFQKLKWSPNTVQDTEIQNS
jgi:hypothetical protein